MANQPTSTEWNIQKVLNWTAQHFSSKQIESSRVDAEVLLAHVLGCKRLDLYLKFDQPMSEEERSRFKEFVQRRASFEPVAYILGEKEFYGRPFRVGPGVLIPRPETEHIVDEVLHFTKGMEQKLKILDVATGSGCLAATLACEISDSEVTAIDISKDAISYAKNNFERLQVSRKIETVCEDYLAWSKNHKETFDIIVSNPPYVAKSADLMKDVKDFEPPQALFGGENGSEILLQWLPEMISQLKPRGILLCEMGYDQKNAVEESFPPNGFSLSFIKDYSSKDRIIKIIKD